MEFLVDDRVQKINFGSNRKYIYIYIFLLMHLIIRHFIINELKLLSKYTFSPKKKKNSSKHDIINKSVRL